MSGEEPKPGRCFKGSHGHVHALPCDLNLFELRNLVLIRRVVENRNASQMSLHTSPQP